jgi:hypothetical protein
MLKPPSGHDWFEIKRLVFSEWFKGLLVRKTSVSSRIDSDTDEPVAGIRKYSETDSAALT